MRVYVSSTSLDLQDHRQAVIEALMRSGHMPVCMEYQPAADVTPKEECMRQVSTCDLYVGIFAWRYGYIPLHCDISITEMEYRTAIEQKIPAIVFLLKEDLSWPEEFRDDDVPGSRIRKLREELKQTIWVSFFTSPDNLAKEVLASLQSRTDKLKGRKQERVPIPVPGTLVMHFQDREAELARLRQCLADKNLRMVLIYGRAGAGKTTLMAKLLLELIENLRDGSAPAAGIIESIVYVTLVDPQNRSPERIVELISRTLEHGAETKLRDLWSQQHIPLRERLALLFSGPLNQRRCLIVLDNLESVLDSDNRIAEECDALRQFVDDFFAYDHAALLIATSRRALSLSPNIEVIAVGRKLQIPLDEGLPESYAIKLLRELDYADVHPLGIRDAQDRVLGAVARRCQYIPRTLETLVAVLLQNYPWTLETLLANKNYLTELVENPAKELYESLSSDQERLVVQTLAVFDRPVPAGAIHSILPSLPVDRILSKLIRNFVVFHDRGQFFLHQLDRQYAYGQIPDVGSDNSKRLLHELVARYYLKLTIPPRGNRTSLEDVLPIINAIEHLIPAGLAAEAATLLFDNSLHEDLHWWGYFLLLQDLYARLLKSPITPKQKVAISIQLGKIKRNLGSHDEAKRIYESALPFIGEATDPASEIGLLNALGDISYYRSDFDRALEYLHRAEELLVLNPIPMLQSENAGDLGNVKLGMGNIGEAKRLYEQAIAFSRQAGTKIHEGIWNGGLGNVECSFFNQSSDPGHLDMAISFYLNAIKLAKDANDRRHESHWSGVLGDLYRQRGQSALAETYLKEALRISEKIHYDRLINTQVLQLAAVFGVRIQEHGRKGDCAAALEVGEAFRRTAVEIGSDKLKAKADLEIIHLLFRQGRTVEATAEGEMLLASATGNVETLSRLGEILFSWGRQTGSEGVMKLSADAYSKAIDGGPDDLLPGLYDGRANARALLGRIEEAIADYGEVVRRAPHSVRAALSLAEVQIWAGRYGDAALLLKALMPQLTTSEDNIIGNWLMCHVLNLEGLDYSANKTIIEAAAGKNICLNYGVKDIELYLQRLDSTKFSEEQIKKAWMIQTLIQNCLGNEGSEY